MATLDYKIYNVFDDMSKDNRWGFLTILILRRNKRNRCWPAMRTIAKKAYPGKMKESAGNLGMATRAKRWLLAHGAITLVKPEHRIGAEKKLARNRHVYQLTGVVVIDKKVYPYLYISGNEHVSGDETIIDEDVSGGEISGGEISGGETSGDETNHSSVVSGISSNQESGSNQESSSKSDDDDDDFNLSEKEYVFVSQAFGGITPTAEKCLKHDRALTIGWAEYALATQICYDKEDKRYVQTPWRYIYTTVVKNGDPVPDMPKMTETRRNHDAQKEKDEAAAAERAKYTDDEWAAMEAETAKEVKKDDLRRESERQDLKRKAEAKNDIKAAAELSRKQGIAAWKIKREKEQIGWGAVVGKKLENNGNDNNSIIQETAKLFKEISSINDLYRSEFHRLILSSQLLDISHGFKLVNCDDEQIELPSGGQYKARVFTIVYGNYSHRDIARKKLENNPRLPFVRVISALEYQETYLSEKGV